MTSARNKPLVSVGLPVYNGERHLRRALGSLLAQDYGNLELIVSDNASNDSTWAICEEYAARDKRIILHRQGQNTGAMPNFQFVLGQARGPYFMWAACDDFWLPGFVTALVEELDAHPDAGLAMCATERVSEDGSLVDRVRYPDTLSPNRMSNFALAVALAFGKRYHFYIYGLSRTELIRRAFVRFPMVAGGDRLFVCQLALATKFRYVDQLFYIRTVQDESIQIRYANEELGQVWSDPFACIKYVGTSGPYLVRSRVIPWHRKLLIPALIPCFVRANSHVLLGEIKNQIRSILPKPIRDKVRQFLVRNAS